ncbi:MAG TPA: hypothetical protein VE263_08755 [Candidatus Angelobacter sp.]|nr:hypothetical protein [Candidatus Angelobacter sp.]
MDETKEQAPVYSSEPSDAATAESRAEAKEIAASITGFDDAEAAPPMQAEPEPPRQNIPWPEPVMKAPPAPANDFLEFLNRTKHIWLIAIGVIFGLMLFVTMSKRMAERAKAAREERHEVAANSVTPDRLIARCGQPAEDVTKNLYPMMSRTISYASPLNGTVVFSFSRTAEENSEWLFLTMKDQTGKSFDTPETKIAALPCLDSKK